jgi:hypothetical protein
VPRRQEFLDKMEPEGRMPLMNWTGARNKRRLSLVVMLIAGLLLGQMAGKAYCARTTIGVITPERTHAIATATVARIHTAERTVALTAPPGPMLGSV